MSTKKHAVKVMIGGEEYTVRSDLPPEYTREVAGFVDQALKKKVEEAQLEVEGIVGGSRAGNP